MVEFETICLFCEAKFRLTKRQWLVDVYFRHSNMSYIVLHTYRSMRLFSFIRISFQVDIRCPTVLLYYTQELHFVQNVQMFYIKSHVFYFLIMFLLSTYKDKTAHRW